MGKVRKEIGVLKLVRAGGIVELYKHPIKAAQVMERYPRHCVTRPDVFKFPYIVVKPESVLKPGQVFFIVPHHTIHRLLQSKGYRCHRQYIPDHYEAVRKKTQEYGQPSMEPNLHRRLVRQASDKTLDDQMEEIDTSFFHQIIPVENFQNKKQINNHEQKVIPRARQVSDLSVEENVANGSFKDGDYDSDEACVAAASGCFPVKKKGGGLVEVSKGRDSRKATTTSLKPCLKMHQTSRKRSQQGPRVRFTLPDEDDDEKWDTDFSDF
ncbi:hypothetical protein L6452_08499 [Arctium lappa]|uniref:Uncharacterized protein n=1 Tax=Arctium lappa TaxID=4217 RepID=A0ACB9DHD5_ARCLA|nr:hypothetical protein L6452_08499 [Arctium lappa]